MRTILGVLLAALSAGALVACTEQVVRPEQSSAPTTATTSPSAEPTPTPTPTGPATSDGRPRNARLTIPKIDVDDLRVVAYRGKTDDGRGTVIQNRGHAASPYGPKGGVGPGGIGNYQVTAHRLSSTQAFIDLPRLRRGDRIEVETGNVRYVYEVTKTRRVSFRSPASLAKQRAEVPGKPGAVADRAYITLSTCLTPEDHAAGNFWSDEFGNPEHRIDKIGVLVDTEPR
ncbi:MAG: class E sortase [Aeromicrobium sp.]